MKTKAGRVAGDDKKQRLSTKGEVMRDARGYQLKLPLPVSPSIEPKDNGNGKLSICSSGGWGNAGIRPECRSGGLRTVRGRNGNGPPIKSSLAGASITR